MAAMPSPEAPIRPNPPASKYRPEIDGLRAFAVIAVIINHFNKNLLPSGYLGVDIFFVISGYVITSSLAGRESKNFLDFLTGFYERRIKRLVPALVVFVLITSVLICLFNPDPGLALKTGATSLFGLSNLHLLKQSTDYFAQSTELNPFTHTWSLGVEEQFYLLFPFLIWFSGFGQQTAKGARNLFFWVGAMAIASLIGFIYLYQVNQPAAYFLMSTRLWEMAAGCLLFIGFQKRAKIEQALEQVPPLLVVAAMVGVMYLPVAAAVPATIGIVVLSAVLIACLKRGTVAYKFFTLEKVVYIGLISYSLYLWHWTVLSISRWTLGIYWWTVPFQVGLMVLMAVGSYKYIESPLRRVNWNTTRQVNILGGASLLFACLALIVLAQKNAVNLYLGETEEGEAEDGELTAEKCKRAKSSSDIVVMKECSLKANIGSNSIIAVGDSQMEHLLPLLNALHKNHGTGVFFYTAPGTNFPSLIESRFTGQSSVDFLKKYSKSEKIFRLYLENGKEGDVVLLSSRYELRWGKSPIPLSQRGLKFAFYDEYGKRMSSNVAYSSWKRLFRELVAKASDKGMKVVIFNSIPTFEDPLNPSQVNPQWFNHSSRNSVNYPLWSREALKDNYRKADAFLETLQTDYSNTYLFDIFGALCPRQVQSCLPSDYRDQWHLSKKGAINLYSEFENFLKKNDLIKK